jgi:SAM-dependent methyltransferase
MAKNVLLYCHMKAHGLDDIKDALRVHSDTLYTTNDVNGYPDEDILINLSKRIYSDAYLSKHYDKYDCIYMVNCPYFVYVKPRSHTFRLPLFINLSKLLKPGGVIITGFANHSIKIITGKYQPNYLFFKNDTVEERKKKIKLYKQARLINREVRQKLKQFFIQNGIKLKLLSSTKNKNYMSKPHSIFSTMADWFVMKKT